MRLLLINPKFPESFWSFSWALDKVTRDKKTVNSPLGLATLAALTPADWNITIIDENIQPIDWSFDADIVGVCGMGVQKGRQREILDHFRQRGIYTVAGGSYASLCPEEYADAADTVVAGEAENIWPQFCQDFVSGTPEKLYQEKGEIDVAQSPAPRYDLLPVNDYQKVSLQFSRGCPYRCEFCDIIVMFGRKPRTKTPEQIGRELDLLRAQGVTSVFFVDDNFIGHVREAKSLLKFLIDYQKRHRYTFSFGTESSLNMAQDPELMQLFRDANFEWVFIGIETPSEEGLKQTLKTQNMRGDILDSIRTIYSYGVDIFAGFIVGFDTDDETIFARQAEFIRKSGIAVAMVGLLHALPKTPLYDRLKKEGRLRALQTTDNTRPATNVIPKLMSYDALVAGYEQLQRELMQDAMIYQRISHKLKTLKHPVTSCQFTFKQKIAYLGRLLVWGILPGGPKRLAYFVRSVARTWRHPKQLAPVMTDWIAVLSLKAFSRRYFEKSASQTEVALTFLKGKLNRWVAEPVQRHWIAVRVAVLQDREQIWIDLRERLDRNVAQDLSRALRRTLKRTREAVVLDCQQLDFRSQETLYTLLRKLHRYRHQVHIRLNESLYPRLREELMAFHYTLVPA